MKIAPRWRKVWRDIAEAPLRTALAVLAMTAGVFGLGTILTSYSILSRELAATYRVTRPASAILLGDGMGDATVDAVRRVPGVLDAEARPVIRGRIRVGKEEWAPLVLFVVRDFRDLRIDKFRPEAGAWPPGDEEVLLERTAFSVARAAIDDRVVVKTADGRERTLHIAGSVHAPGLAPAWMDHVVSGFVPWSSVARADAQAESGQLRIVVAQKPLEEGHIREVAERVKGAIEGPGRAVTRIDVPAPGRHPHADQMDTFLYLLGAFGALTFALSAVLVANMIHALLTEQVRQVGVMKAIGASERQIVALYLGQVSILAAVALCLGVPLGLAAGRAYARFAATMLNANLDSRAVPFWVLAVQGAVGLLVPLVVAVGPVARASRITVQQAFHNDIARQPFGSRPFDRWLARIRWLPRPLMLSLRATFHRRGRLLLTVGTLAAGGAGFISALNVSAAWRRALEADARARRYDMDVRLPRPYPAARVAEGIAALPAIVHAEYWVEAPAELVGRSVHGDTRVNLIAPDPGSALLELPLLQGRRLHADDGAAVLINQVLLARAPGIRVGGNLVLRVNGSDVSWRVVGLVKELAPFPTAYALPGAVLAATGQASGLTRGARVVTARHDAATQRSVARDLEHALAKAGVEVSSIHSLRDGRQAFADHLVIIQSALLFAAALVVLVGGLGLTSTLTVNVVERTREIGILSAIGALPRTIARHVVEEGLILGALSWCLAVLAAVPVTAALDAVTGQIFIKSSLDFFMSPGAAAAWLALVLLLASVSSFYPAWRSGRLAIREALAYA